MFNSLYRWTIALSESRHAPLALGAVAFAESSFFPIPPDLILIPMALAQPRRAWLYATICTVASVLGGLPGYAIVAGLLNRFGDPIRGALERHFAAILIGFLLLIVAGFYIATHVI